jgi:hypothetical protein
MSLSVAASRGTTRCVRTGAQALRVDGQLERETTLRDFRIEGALDAFESGHKVYARPSSHVLEQESNRPTDIRKHGNRLIR